MTRAPVPAAPYTMLIAGGLDDILRAAVCPVDHGGVGLAVNLDLPPVDHQIAAGVLHGAGEVTENGVVLQQVHHVVDVCFPQVDTAHIETLRIIRQYTKYYASNAPKAVNADLDSHVIVLPSSTRPWRLYLFQVHYYSLLKFVTTIVKNIS